MTYWRYLALFVAAPMLVLAVLAWRERGRRALPATLRALPPWLPLVALAAIALVYTTPWDNYLVATGVWYYDPDRVGGIVLGWVPLEEYSFFVLQTLLVGLWFVFLARRLPAAPVSPSRPARLLPLTVGIALWLPAVTVLAIGWQPGTYLGLELAWFVPPLALQLWFGGDILASRRRLLLATLLPAILYLSATDALAIAAGVWTISPAATVGIDIGPLPLEELVFFSLTSALIAVSMVLALSAESIGRLMGLRRVLLAGHSLRPTAAPGNRGTGPFTR
ncbi:MAG: lycopene cyclase domain-containing protein [Anaerolineae bacterium]